MKVSLTYEMQNDVLSLFPELEKDLSGLRTTGTLPFQDIEEMVHSERLSATQPITQSQIQPASVDLRLGSEAYLIPASFLPGKHHAVLQKLRHIDHEVLDLTQPTILERGKIYLVPLLESLRLPVAVWAKANPKSTSGRLDVFTRLITDYGTEFERVPCGYKGPLYLEIMPRSFSIQVHAGTRLCQLRFIRGTPTSSDTSLNLLNQHEPLVYLADDQPGDPVISEGLWISADLLGDGGGDTVGYKAKSTSTPIDLEKVDYYDSAEFWEPITAVPEHPLCLAADQCYILLSRERLRVPPAWAAEMVPFDPSVGEFRVHYAGFFDPGFGYGDDTVKGTPAVLEVRSHGIPFMLEHGQMLGRFVFERLLSAPSRLYGAAIGSSYHRQGLCLSKQFRRGGI